MDIQIIMATVEAAWCDGKRPGLGVRRPGFYLFIYLFLTSLLEYNCFTMVC